MPTVTLRTLQWIQDEVESKEAQISELEHELELALEENLELKAHISRLMSDRSLAV